MKILIGPNYFSSFFMHLIGHRFLDHATPKCIVVFNEDYQYFNSVKC